MAKFTNKRSWYLLNSVEKYILALMAFGVFLFFFNRLISPYLPKDGILHIFLWIFEFTLLFAGLKEGLKWRKSADNFLTGDDGETIVEDILKKLPDEYIVIPDLKLPKLGNIDFVVVGPTGIFALEVKNYRRSYKIKFNGKSLTFNGKIWKKDSLRQTINNAITLGTHLRTALNDPYISVIPVLVFTGRQILRFGLRRVKNNARVIRQEFLLNLLTKKSNQVLSATEAERIAEKIKTAFQSQ